MSDRIRYLTVILERDLRDDDAEPIMNALRLIRGVSDVVYGEPVRLADWVNRRTVRHELRAKLFEVLSDD